jgi:hypothetical protein
LGILIGKNFNQKKKKSSQFHQKNRIIEKNPQKNQKSPQKHPKTAPKRQKNATKLVRQHFVCPCDVRFRRQNQRNHRGSVAAGVAEN